MKRISLLFKVTAFVTATLTMTGLLVVVFGGFRFEPTTTYHAVFEDISGMRTASVVRAAGVDVGRVEETELLPDNTIRVTFTVGTRIPLTTGSTAVVRYKNLVGDRYLQLGPGPGPALPPDGTIPRSRTRPALDLDELYNGFAPLFQGLAPEQVNRLSSALIAVLQGQGGAVEGLLADLGSVTTTLADHGTLISDVVTQLNTVLETLVQRAPELTDTIVTLRTLVSGLAEDRERIGGSLADINGLTTSLGGLLAEQRPDIQGTITQLGAFSRTINADQAALDNLIRRLPGYYIPLGRLGANQSAFQFYVCGVQLRFTTPAGRITTPFINSGDVPRC
ncbi:MCE family protein [Actinophytocola oryzae]|uniref:Phospholipid/cholesterol/gamma-HCH transport system substrate-binding protein n=1 Tax=Actinophytocola oryzae TaxID=502181 RepID=A0A4R7W090_9PSEU|nr:MCE family protein [Actinophytocola oryzae]TDV55358.1 phospholipid/cholesterol/gamma-HCH transport system substrate-binding protein [Actinophytocola oryzae]